jgi:hypothetical protein
MLESINAGAVIADKAYDTIGLIDKLTEQRVTPVIPPKANKARMRFRALLRAQSHRAFLTRLSTSVALQRATTNWRETILPQFSWSPRSSCLIEDGL